ncbi:MAG: tetratricopeptide repeat protein [Pedobacter sp.]|nr:MAG: tetratricopeptide repeat protein [Pedobacter sp.]
MKNNEYKLICILFILLSLLACQESKEKLAFKLFNEGVKYSLDAADEAEKGKFDSALELNRKAIEKFLETYKTDSTHQLVKSVLGHSYYIQKDYKEGIHWYELANKLDSSIAVNYKELGLCKINLGDIKNGALNINKALELDNSKENKENTILDLKDIGILAFKYGEDYDKQGNKEKGLDYKKFAIGVLSVANNLDTTNFEIKNSIAEYAKRIGDISMAKKYKKK